MLTTLVLVSITTAGVAAQSSSDYLTNVQLFTAPPDEPTSSEQLYSFWKPFSTPLVIPEVIDMRKGGNLQMNIGETTHEWGSGAPSATTYGYGKVGGNITTPGPTILVSKDVPITVQWNNAIKSSTHLLDSRVEKTLVRDESACYPNCGVPVITHIHGLETPAQFDGLPHYSIYRNQSFTARYNNTQSGSTKLYHDHAMGLTRLNVWAGLAGMYVIQDAALEKSYNLDSLVDIPLIIQDKIIYPDGTLVYSSVATCQTPGTKWVSEAFGAVNVVNGVVMPYLEVPAQQVRFRIANLANARHYNLTLPFASQCTLIATDSGFVGAPESVNPLGFWLFPLERVELVCDFSSYAAGTSFTMTDTPSADSSYAYDPRILQIRVVAAKASATKVLLPQKMTAFKDLQALYKSTNGKLRTITLGEMDDADACPMQLMILQRQMVANVSLIQNKLMCTLGKVEKWQFKNPTDDAHPFHWHLVNAQCGPDDNSINKNQLKDVVVIPNVPKSQDVLQVCYVACVPDKFLLEGSTASPTDYGFSTDEPYLAHCHILEHEENAMMSWFQLMKQDDDAPVDDGSIPDPNAKATPEVIWCAMGMSVLGGLATCLSVLVLSIKRLNFLAGDRALAITFALSSGVMLFISLVDLFAESTLQFNSALATGGDGGLTLDQIMDQGLSPTAGSVPVCDATCHGQSYLATVGCFMGGVIIIVLLEVIVHKVFDFKAKRLGQQLAAQQGLPTPQPAPQELNELIIKTPNGEGEEYSKMHVDEDFEDEALTEDSTEEMKSELGRAGIMTGIAIAIHNFPEGLALFVASLGGLRSGIVLAIGIIMHNFPEGVAIAGPVYYATKSYKQALFWTGLSGISQPCGALIGYATIANGVSPTTIGILYGLVSGMLVCICVKELIPGAFKFDPKVFTSAFFFGFLIMAVSVVLLKYMGSS
ncbi:Aste57867_1224 [Aphanomyces stellatus]|uniref:Aste57867_1224 protein n=1 Tax=Aphanomyces stellatus TaxID=120398 RepID=A0A485K808_9STRA|nr:hypothetical protein As57867_001223 [Aphanomyces stellatus]VFT78444.1 Aste57867_1224 [Aphanomyces stellatus]